ncbi:component of SufBCD complex [Qingshengfaniella alkalisoli]|uniref:Component of SufBCD complex n=1 Tax=Qingshengfaniella alkalisoli TaxID=2599296 RepID=A0A5B8IVX9_9RHOB|nr:component of SufBCD complex [Qingshengfaniella alkalisoli]QDY69031.1 component of SufBCD complex [Qingshengfaniella alkalisoli]
MPESIFEFVDFRSFSNVWYWLFAAVLWMRLIHAPLGVAPHLLRRARDGDTQGQADVIALAGFHARRVLETAGLLGVWRSFLWAFVLSALAVLSIRYGKGFAQAVFLLAIPLAFHDWLTGRASRAIIRAGYDFDTIAKTLNRLRLHLQIVVFIMIFLTAMWGSYRNLMTYTFF